MEYPLSEIIDRLSILRLKLDRLPRDKQLQLEHDRFTAALSKFSHSYISLKFIQEWLAAQLDVNRQIWDLEADIRQGKEGLLGIEEVGRRALKLRDLNKERLKRKNAIARSMGEFEEVKIDHASEEK